MDGSGNEDTENIIVEDKDDTAENPVIKQDFEVRSAATDDITGVHAAGNDPDTGSQAMENEAGVTVVPKDICVADTVSEGTDLSTNGKKKKQKRPKKDKFNIIKDIRYRGPLSYRHLKILGWICIILSQVGVIEGFKLKLTGSANSFFCESSIMEMIRNAALPLLLISVFAVLLKKRENYKNAILIYGVLAVGMIGLFLLVYFRYILGTIQPLLENSDKVIASKYLTEVIHEDQSFKGFISFNIFIDIFICTLVMFFMDYTPKRFFTGKKLIIFRCFVILPMLYEVACVYIKIMATNHLISIPLWISPFLTTKPPISILMFLSIVRYIKIQEKKFLETGRTLEEYEEYRKTNTHSLEFAKHLILIIFVYAILDLIILIFFSAAHIVIMNGISGGNLSEEMVSEAIGIVMEWGFGGTLSMVDLIPIVLLFSYTRSHKQLLIDTAIPIIGVIAIVIVYIDGFFQIFQNSLGSLGVALMGSLGT